ncbi:MAG: hypothetical protein ABIH78_04070 [Candidatus Peregrinibacteria bacterium]
MKKGLNAIFGIVFLAILAMFSLMVAGCDGKKDRGTIPTVSDNEQSDQQDSQTPPVSGGKDVNQGDENDQDEVFSPDPVLPEIADTSDLSTPQEVQNGALADSAVRSLETQKRYGVLSDYMFQRYGVRPDISSAILAYDKDDHMLLGISLLYVNETETGYALFVSLLDTDDDLALQYNYIEEMDQGKTSILYIQDEVGLVRLEMK